MKQKEFYYVKINEQTNMIYSIGLSFAEFIESVSYKPQNVLLLKGNFINSSFNLHTRFEYVTSNHLPELYCDNVYNYGDFCWLDYEDYSCVESLSELEIAKLLYAAHKFKILENPFFLKLKNKYLYLTHDDEYNTRIYMQDLKDYKNVIIAKLYTELKGRRRHMTDISQEINNELYQLAIAGMLIDFNNICRDKNYVSVQIYQLGDLCGYDAVEQTLYRKKQGLGTFKTLEYKRGKWKLMS